MTLRHITTLAVGFLLLTTATASAASPASPDCDAAVFIILGQSNADGSAFSDPAIDKEMWEYYTSNPEATEKLNVWYRSTQVRNERNALGQMARHVIDGRYTDMAPQWMKLWYRNDNTARRTAMNMIHGAGSYSDMAQGRRGIEGRFGQRWAQSYPDTELYVIKLGASGSGIDTWANPADDHNWAYFADSVYTPAMKALTDAGKHPRLAGVWWMQGCADTGMNEATYEARLDTLINRLDTRLGFSNAPIYIGTIPAPGESTVTPTGSVGYSPTVRKAQEAVAGTHPRVTLISTADASMQYEEPFKGCIHFNHSGVNRIADLLIDAIVSATPAAWPRYKSKK